MRLGLIAGAILIAAGACSFDQGGVTHDGPLSPELDGGADAPSLPGDGPVPDASTLVYREDFESYADGDDPADWLDTGSDNSLEEEDELFRIRDLGGNKALLTFDTDTNIHSHYTGGALDGLRAYEIRGRLLVADTDGGVGVTFFSDYPQADAYYRLRRNAANATFHIAPHPDGLSVTGDADSDVDLPPNTWHRFRVQVVAGTAATTIRARVWRAGTPEPSTWSIDAVDTAGSRYQSGTIGVWSMGPGAKAWDDLEVHRL